MESYFIYFLEKSYVSRHHNEYGVTFQFLYTVCNIFAPFFPIWITRYPPIRTINFGKYLRLFQIKPIETVKFRFIQIGKKRAKILHTIITFYIL
jgi:hypothetical protein